MCIIGKLLDIKCKNYFQHLKKESSKVRKDFLLTLFIKYDIKTK